MSTTSPPSLRPVLAGLALLGMTAGPAVADPCGMVPPITIADGKTPAIQRQGAQRTYVMFHDGVETMALRPGFVGKIDDFGMLIPFPTAPALRKIEDDTFHHLEGLVDPPEIDVHLYEPYRYYLEEMAMADGPASRAEPSEEAEDNLRYDEVKVLNQEAVGMYQVAVLAAGSPKALSRWMSENGYRYPDGMDAVVQDYVTASWCFVAIKATVGQAPGVTPQPGMRGVDPKLPEGASFDGHVQGMGFRFKTDSPVIPMRLSVFNPDASGDGPRNVVYVLTEGGVKLADIGEQTVVRQIPGHELYRRSTEKLGINWHNGTEKDLDPSSRPQLEAMRDPTPYLGIARELVASDLHAIAASKGGEGELSLPFEEEEKELLRISEAFGLRGAEIDALHGSALDEHRAWITSEALGGIKDLTLTVIDGSLPVEVLARQNLTFESYELPRGAELVARNDPLQPHNPGISLPKKESGR